MLIKKYNAPCRVGYVPSPYEPDEDGVMDVPFAWNAGVWRKC